MSRGSKRKGLFSTANIIGIGTAKPPGETLVAAEWENTVAKVTALLTSAIIIW
jgi:hypothetical protein